MRVTTSNSILLVAVVLNWVATIAIFVGVVLGIYWPFAQIVWGNPLNIFWAVPVGLLIAGIATWIQQTLFALFITVPLGTVAMLIRGKEA